MLVVMTHCLWLCSDSYGGFLGQQLVTDFATYASTVVAALGNRVTYWTTFNEPNSICSLGFGSGGMAPGLQVCAQVACFCAWVDFDQLGPSAMRHAYST